MSRLAARAVLGVFAAASLAYAESVSDYAVRVSAVVQTNPASITLSWPANVEATNCIRYRKTRDATSWGAGTSLSANATNYVDSTVAVGSAYEYRISRTAWNGTTNYSCEGYIYAGINLPVTESRGKIVLLVDSTMSASLAMELARLQLDLVGDGWTVLRHDVSRADSVANIKAIIKADYLADTANVKAVFLLGHVPVPYSGNLGPDGHAEHVGAWPADVYYGEMNSTWTDTGVNTVTASDPRNRNVPGDGKFDQSLLPSDVELQVGRVDLANLPSFPSSEPELLRQYLNKNHNFRHKFLNVERRILIDDNFGVFGGEAFAVSGWRNGASFFGAPNVIENDWLTTLSTQSYLWGYGCGSGYTGAGGVAGVADLVVSDPRVVFTMLFGSFFGDWDSPDNFLRAQLASASYTLASAWVGRPCWQFHHMGLGETIGFSARVSQNNSTTYAANFAARWVHVALMGDPTLRMHPVASPAALSVSSNGVGRVQLKWVASADTVAGYYIYRASTTAGLFTRLNNSLITATSYLDSLSDTNVYMVRAVKLEESASGTYYNPSQGVFQSLNPAIATPAIVLVQPTNDSIFVTPATLRLVTDTFDPANSITNVTFFANGVNIGIAAAPPFGLIWSNPPLGIYSVAAQAFCASGLVTNSNPVTVTVDNAATPRLLITSLGNGTNRITGAEVLGRAYRLQFLDNPMLTNWQTFGSATGSVSGTFEFFDSASTTQRFYRTVFP